MESTFTALLSYFRINLAVLFFSISSILSFSGFSQGSVTRFPPPGISDTTICQGTEYKIKIPKKYTTILWEDGSDSHTRKIDAGGHYSVSLTTRGKNLIKTGLFQSVAKIGSDYRFLFNGRPSDAQLTNEGEYAFALSPNLVNPDYPPTKGHEGGYLMILNGATKGGTRVWYEEVEIEPYTDYEFESWIMNFSEQNPATLMLYIDGMPVGSAFQPKQPLFWERFFVKWNSQDNSIAEISIVDLTTTREGNDFGIDDISFTPVIKEKYSFDVREIDCGKLDFSEKNYKPSNIVLLLDVSKSMEEQNKMSLLKASMLDVSLMLRPIDKLTIISYSNDANLELKTTSGDDKSSVATTIKQLKTSGSTSGGDDGLKLAFKKARKALIKDGNNMVLMATDGGFTGNQGEMIKLIDKYHKKGIQLSIVGIMNQPHEEKTLRRMMEHSNGRYLQVQSPEETKDILIEDIKLGAKKQLN